MHQTLIFLFSELLLPLVTKSGTQKKNFDGQFSEKRMGKKIIQNTQLLKALSKALFGKHC